MTRRSLLGLTLLAIGLPMPSGASASVTAVGGGQLSGQSGAIAVSPQGNAYVLATTDSKVYEYDPTGALLNAGGSYAGHMWDTPAGAHGSTIAVDAAGHAFIAQDSTSGIIELNPDLTYDTTLAATEHIVSLAAAGTTLYAMRRVGATYTLEAYANGAGVPTTHLFTAGSDTGSLAATDDDPQIAVGPDGTIYVVDTGNHRVIELSSALVPQTVTLATGLSDFSDQPVSIATGGSAIAPAGSVLLGGTLAPAGAQIQNYFGGIPTGSVVGSAEGPFSDLSGLASVASGDAYASVRGTGGTVQHFDVTPEPAFTVSPPTALTGQPVTFSAAGSKIDLWGLQGYRWDFEGAGTYAADGKLTPAITHVFTRPGTYTVGLKSFGFNGRAGTTTASYTVAPAPPPGRIGLSINLGAIYTNNPNVFLSPIWPAGETAASVANDPAFATARTVTLGAPIPWTMLIPRAPQHFPQAVYIRFGASTQLYTDTILIDTIAPTITQATITVPKTPLTRPSVIHLRATDSSSGLIAYQVTRKRSSPGNRILLAHQFVGKHTIAARLNVKNVTYTTVYLRLIDRAGNASKWTVIPVPKQKTKR